MSKPDPLRYVNIDDWYEFADPIEIANMDFIEEFV